jgi:hypothetical protein
MKRLICECGERMFIFRNALKPHIKIQYCETCKKHNIAHNQPLDKQIEQVAKQEAGIEDG